jgi:hypothetical protein
MGQKSNIVTSRKTQKNLSFQGSDKHSKQFLYGLKFLKFLEQLLNQKNITLTDKTLNFVNNKVYLNITFLFKTAKLKGYKKSYSKSLNIQKERDSITKFFVDELSSLRISFISLNLRVINKEVNEKIGRFFYAKTKRFIKTLLPRRFSLFADFIKATSLLCENKISIQAYLSLLAQIFRVLRKKIHSRFLLFLKELLSLLTIVKSKSKLSSDHNIKGIKFLANGKLRGKTRSSSSCIQMGAVPIQSLGKEVSFAKIRIYTLYGVFGFRMWIHRS